MTAADEPITKPAADVPGLRRDAIGLREVLFQSITDMAPGAAIAASIPAGAAFAGGALPLSVVFALVACLFCAFCIAELAKHLPSAGSLATFAARGLHDGIGFLVAWAYSMVGVLIPPLVLLQLGFTTASTIHGESSGYPANLWWPWTILGALIVCAAGYYGVRTSARMGSILGAFEIAVFLVLAVFFVVHAGSHNSGTPFSTKYTPSAHAGISGVIAGSVYSILAFGGFEGAAPLAEEARNPRRTIRIAVLGATLSIGLLYVFTTYAATVVAGPGRFAGFSGAGSLSWVGLARSLYGIFWFFVFLAIVNSTIANANAGVNVSTRTAFAMGRIGAFPFWLARLHLRHRSPYVSIFVATAASLAISLGLGFGYDPLTAFALVGTAIVILLVAIYIVSNIACFGFFARHRRAEFNPVFHVLIPALGIAAFVPAWLTAAGIPAFSFVSKLPAPISYAGPAMAVWMVLGLIWLIVLYRRHPARVTEVARVHLEDEMPEAMAIGGGSG
jgi:amino acid transporter